MNFIKFVDQIPTTVIAKRIASAYVADYRRLSLDEIKEFLIKTAPQYTSYDNIAESKLVDQIHRTFMKLLMPIYVLLDNLRIPHDLLSRFIRWYANKYSRHHENSSLVSQPISVPWEKFLKEPIFNSVSGPYCKTFPLETNFCSSNLLLINARASFGA